MGIIFGLDGSAAHGAKPRKDDLDWKEVSVKICYRCKEEQPSSEFYVRKSANDGRHPWCKECCRSAEREAYKNDPKQKNKGQRTLEQQKSWEETRLRNHGHPCPDCGIQVQKTSLRCKPCAGIFRRGSGSVQYKDGITIHAGYVYFSGYHEHPNSSKQGRIAEHTLVLTEHIGRPLFDYESVHHKNKVRYDNRIENLELWTGSQPSGARVDDMIDWMVHFLDQYGYDTTKRSQNALGQE